MDAPLKEKKSKGPEKYEIENWARTIVEAEEIKKDKAKMKYVAPLLEKKLRVLHEISSIAELKNIRQKKMEDMEEGMGGKGNMKRHGQMMDESED